MTTALLKEGKLDEANYIHACIREASRQIKKNTRAGAERAEAVHQNVDQAIERALKEPLGQTVTCRKGCAFCCYIFVSSTDDEAALIAKTVREKKIPIDMERLERQAQYTESDWPTMSQEMRRCPMLGPDNMCQVYEQRPSTCRSHYVVSDPKECDVETVGVKDIQLFNCPEAVMLSAAAADVNFKVGENDSLPARLLRRIRAYDRKMASEV